MTEKPYVPSLIGARVVERHIVELTFVEGTQARVDLAPYLAESEHASKLDDYREFCRLRLDKETGTIVWPDGTLLERADLYRWAGDSPESRFRKDR